MQMHTSGGSWRVFPEHKFEYSSITTLSPPTIKSISRSRRSNGFSIWYCGIRPRISMSSGIIKAYQRHREKAFLIKGHTTCELVTRDRTIHLLGNLTAFRHWSAGLSPLTCISPVIFSWTNTLLFITLVLGSNLDRRRTNCFHPYRLVCAPYVSPACGRTTQRLDGVVAIQGIV